MKANLEMIISNNNTSINFIKIKKISKFIIVFLILINYSFNQSDSDKNKHKYTVLGLNSNYSYSKKEFNSSRLLEGNDRDDFLNELRYNISHNLIQEEDTTIKYGNIIFEITSTKKEKYRENNDISIISLGECEKNLRNLYNIGSDQELIIFNYQYLVEGLSAPIIEYEIYRKFDSYKEKLNLSYCKDNVITILVPAYESSKFHLYEENCQYLGSDFEPKKDTYQCKVKTEMRLISEINTQTLIKMEKLNDFYNLISNEDNLNDTNNKENIIETIQNALKNGIFNNFMQSALYSQPEGIIINSTNTYFQIIPADIQQYDDNDNETYEYNYLSRLNLSDCINILKNNYSIIPPLILFKMDHYLDGVKTPIVEYEIYQKNGSGPLNLTVCKDVNVKLEIPVSLKEDDSLKYNLSSDYCTDMCYSYKTEKGTDILLKDRQNECLNNNIFIYDENCHLKNMTLINKLIYIHVKLKQIFLLQLILPQ